MRVIFFSEIEVEHIKNSKSQLKQGAWKSTAFILRLCSVNKPLPLTEMFWLFIRMWNLHMEIGTIAKNNARTMLATWKCQNWKFEIFLQLFARSLFTKHEMQRKTFRSKKFLEEFHPIGSKLVENLKYV